MTSRSKSFFCMLVAIKVYWLHISIYSYNPIGQSRLYNRLFNTLLNYSIEYQNF